MTPLSEQCSWAKLDDDRIILIQLSDTTRNTIDAWVDFAINVREHWEISQRLLILVDMSGGDFAFSPYANSRSREMMSVRPEIKESIAIVVRRSIMGQLMSMAMQASNRLSGTSLQVCHSREDALRWLRAQGQNQR